MIDLAHVGRSYLHYPKRAVPSGLLRAGTSEIKLYHLEKPGEPVPEPVAASAREFLLHHAAAAAGLADDHGFAILHRCGTDFHFLLLAVWRGSNEAWEAVWYRDAGMSAFAPFQPAYPSAPGVVRPTFCIWELGIVAHESAAWARVLAAPRGEAALADWRAGMVEGAV